MKKVFTTLLLITAIFNFSFADKVDNETAQKVAINHLLKMQDYIGNVNLNLVHTYNTTIISVFNPGLLESTPLLYIYDIGDDNGIIIVSGDDVAIPILGYTNSGYFDISDLPYSFKKWIKDYKNQINYAIENDLEPETYVEDEGTELINGIINNQSVDNTTVNPLCKTPC